MGEQMVKNKLNRTRRRLLEGVISAGAVATGCAATRRDVAVSNEKAHGNSLLWAAAWKQTAAEYFALCHQAYNLAHLRVERSLQQRRSGDRPLAVITDMDDTIMHARSYWGYLIQQDMDFFDDDIWDRWLPENEITAAPGAAGFFDFCAENSVEVFYVTNRDQGPETYTYAMRQLMHLGFPYADEAHLYVFRDTSDKTPARDEIRARFDIAVTLGDNLNDYKRDYYVADIEDRMRIMERDRLEFGREFVLLPNPTDGHWVRAIFGDSEPAPTAENRHKLREAATYKSWSGKPSLD